MMTGETRDVSRQLTELDSAVSRAIEERFKDRATGLENLRASLESFVTYARNFGSVLALAIVGAGFFLGNSLSALKTDVKDSATAEMQRAIDSKINAANEDGKTLKATIDELRTISSEMARLKSELAGYTALAEAAKSSRFDPLVGFYAIDQEIDRRLGNLVAMSNGQRPFDLKETTRDPEFRQRAAGVFVGLFEEIEADKKNGRRRVDSATMFNAASSASKMGLNFVALSLMEQTVDYAKALNPNVPWTKLPQVEHTSRLIRQRLTMGAVSREEALLQLGDVLSVSNGTDLRNVLAESFNIGPGVSDPVRVAELIAAKLPKDLLAASYSTLIRARLYAMGHQPQHWAEAKRLFDLGKADFGQESATAIWRNDSAEEIAFMSQIFGN
jgi:hypothetical protein